MGELAMRELSPLLTIDGVCAYLGIGKSVAYEMVRKGEIPHLRIRNKIRVDADDLVQYVRRNTKGDGTNV